MCDHVAGCLMEHVLTYGYFQLVHREQYIPLLITLYNYYTYMINHVLCYFNSYRGLVGLPVPVEQPTKGLKKAYIRAYPSILRSMENERNPATLVIGYRKLVTAVLSTMHMPMKHPHNIKQVNCIRSRLLEKNWLSHGALCNLYELASDVPNFVQFICTHPELVCLQQQSFTSATNRLSFFSTALV